MEEDELIARIRAHRSTRGHGVATVVDLDAFEAFLGLELPPLLRRIYREVANGGVGPGPGLIGIPPNGFDVEELENWEEALLDGEMPVVNWGCGGFSTIDLSDPDGPVTTSEPGADDGADVDSEWDSLHEWLVAWLSGQHLSPFAKVSVSR